MDKIILHREQLEDLEFDLLSMLEESFNFKFEEKELLEIENFDDLCTIIISKIDGKDNAVCTSSIAFYQLRRAIENTSTYDISKLTPNTKLKDILPKKHRLRLIKRLEKQLGYELDILEPDSFSLQFTAGLLVGCFISLFYYHWSIGFTGIAFFSLSVFLLVKYKRTLRFKTLRDLIEYIICENYLKIRRGRNSVNRRELKEILMNWFSTNLYLEKDELKLVSFKR